MERKSYDLAHASFLMAARCRLKKIAIGLMRFVSSRLGLIEKSSRAGLAFSQGFFFSKPENKF
jgi:hypothetical protein